MQSNLDESINAWLNLPYFLHVMITCWRMTQNRSSARVHTFEQTFPWGKDTGRRIQLSPETLKASPVGCSAPQPHNKCWRKRGEWRTSRATVVSQHFWWQTYKAVVLEKRKLQAVHNRVYLILFSACQKVFQPLPRLLFTFFLDEPFPANPTEFKDR